MTTNPIEALTSNFTGTNATTEKPSETGKDDFLKLLVEQLKNQDPMAPMDSTQFIAQLAQFNSLERLISIDERLGQLLNR